MTDKKIAIISDTTSDIPQELLKKHNIYRVPLYVIWGQEELKDQFEITSEAFYTRLDKDPVTPRTSQPTPKDFLDVLEQAKADGADEAIIITISSGLSGTHESANQAATSAPIPTQVLDSYSASMGHGWQVLAAARARDNGASAAEILDAARRVRNNLQLIFTLDTLEYLHKNGRIGGASRLLGSALNIKPKLYVDHEQGSVETSGRTRTRKKALQSVYDDFLEAIEGKKNIRAAVLHALVEAEANEIIEKLRQEIQPVEIITGVFSPVIGAHTGPGSIVITGYGEDKA